MFDLKRAEGHVLGVSCSWTAIVLTAVKRFSCSIWPSDSTAIKLVYTPPVVNILQARELDVCCRTSYAKSEFGQCMRSTVRRLIVSGRLEICQTSNASLNLRNFVIPTTYLWPLPDCSWCRDWRLQMEDLLAKKLEKFLSPTLLSMLCTFGKPYLRHFLSYSDEIW